MVATKSLCILSVIFGFVICINAAPWLLEAICQPECDITYEGEKEVWKACDNNNPSDPRPCEGPQAFSEIPTLKATRMCTKSSTVDGDYYLYANQTSDSTVQTWKCYDPLCTRCEKDKVLRSTRTPLRCSKTAEKKFFATDSFPDMKQFYGKSEDPNKNWYRMVVDGTSCNADSASSVTFYPWKFFTEYAITGTLSGRDCKEDYCKNYCAINRCTDGRTLNVYPHSKSRTNGCNWDDQTGPVTKQTLTGCDQCVQM